MKHSMFKVYLTVKDYLEDSKHYLVKHDLNEKEIKTYNDDGCVVVGPCWTLQIKEDSRVSKRTK